MEKGIGGASIYKFTKKDKILVHSDSQLQMGAGVASEPFIWLPGNASLNNVVEAMIVAISQSKKGLPNPKDWSEVLREFLSASGLKKESELYKDAKLVSVYHKDGFISFTPTVNMGKKGFQNVPNAGIKIARDATPEKIGETLALAFDKCE